ncbi:hypothetical protein [Paenimyroides ceti]
MKHLFIYFWVLFILYFIIAHPAIIYYNIKSDSAFYLENKDPVMALVLLFLSVTLWAFFLGWSFRLIYKSTFILKKNISFILSKGKALPTKIISVTRLSARHKDLETKEITVEFLNFSNQLIRHTLIVNDSKPELNRYREGNTLKLYVDRELKKEPFIVSEGIQVAVNYKKLIFMYAIWMLFLSFIIWYYYYSYETENKGYGWRFVTFEHPLVSSALMLALFSSIGYFIVYKLFISRFAGVKKTDALRLKFYGIKTTATVINASQTGTLINDQPEIKFTLQYEDNKGKSHQVSIKKVVQLIHLYETKEKQKTIFYLPDEPQITAFENDINAIQ